MGHKITKHERKVHLRHGAGTWCNSFNNIDGKELTNELEATSCKTCLAVHERYLSANLHSIASAARYNKLSAEEIFTILDQIYDNPKKMSQYAECIIGLNSAVSGGLLSKEQIIDNIKAALCKQIMET